MLFDGADASIMQESFSETKLALMILIVSIGYLVQPDDS